MEKEGETEREKMSKQMKQTKLQIDKGHKDPRLGHHGIARSRAWTSRYCKIQVGSRSRAWTSRYCKIQGLDITVLQDPGLGHHGIARSRAWISRYCKIQGLDITVLQDPGIGRHGIARSRAWTSRYSKDNRMECNNTRPFGVCTRPKGKPGANYVMTHEHRHVSRLRNVSSRRSDEE